MTKSKAPVSVSSLIVVLVTVVVVASATAWLISRQALSERINSFAGESAQTRFLSYATRIAPLRRLELAKLNQVGVFERKSEASLFWTRLKLPDVVVSASVPVEYNYFVEINDSWRILMTESSLTVIAPALTHSVPAADVSALRFEVKAGSLFRNESEVAYSLKNEITSLLETRAQQSAGLVRETARKELENLAGLWLKQEGKQVSVEVIFADERLPAGVEIH